MLDLGNLTYPFGRIEGPLPPHKILQPCHCVRDDFNNLIHNAEFNGLPQYPEELKLIPPEYVEDLLNLGKLADFEIKKQFCYLWVLNRDKIFEIIWEGTSNEKDTTGKLVKHSNITAGGEAYNGGEMYFSTDNKIYINNESDRYGKYPEHWKQVVEYFSKIYIKYEVISIQL